jgi:TrmH family RNA methyltransferase
MPKTATITSAANPMLKHVRRAIVRGALTPEGCCVAETFHLLEEALRSDCEVKVVLTAESVRATTEAYVRTRPEIPMAVLADRLFQSISATETSQGVIALVKLPDWSWEQLLTGEALVVVLDGLQDPGNAGTIVRTAEAFGASGAVFLKGSVSPYNPKTLRASAGSLFRLPFLHGLEPGAARATLQERGVALYAGVPVRQHESHPLERTDLRRPCGLVIGNEARGVSEEFRAASLPLSIPTVAVESLNAAVAAGVLLYEARRQRTLRP